LIADEQLFHIGVVLAECYELGCGSAVTHLAITTSNNALWQSAMTGRSSRPPRRIHYKTVAMGMRCVGLEPPAVVENSLHARRRVVDYR
jgi:hypothetical protein